VLAILNKDSDEKNDANNISWWWHAHNLYFIFIIPGKKHGLCSLLSFNSYSAN
jgi:hypothetical protein